MRMRVRCDLGLVGAGEKCWGPMWRGTVCDLGNQPVDLSVGRKGRWQGLSKKKHQMLNGSR